MTNATTDTAHATLPPGHSLIKPTVSAPVQDAPCRAYRRVARWRFSAFQRCCIGRAPIGLLGPRALEHDGPGERGAVRQRIGDAVIFDDDKSVHAVPAAGASIGPVDRVSAWPHFLLAIM